MVHLHCCDSHYCIPYSLSDLTLSEEVGETFYMKITQVAIWADIFYVSFDEVM